MVFPVLQLPSVALRQVLGGLSASELFELQTCSRYTKHTLKPYEKANRTFKVGVDFQRNFVEIRGVRKFFSKNEEIGDDARVHEKKRVFDGQEVPVEDAEPMNIDTYWPQGQTTEGTKKTANSYIKSLGLGAIDHVTFWEHNDPEEVLHWFETTQMKMENFNLIGANPAVADVLADKVYSDEFFRRVTANYISLLETSKDFVPSNFKADKAINMVKLQVHNAHWFTGRHLLAFNCPAVVLEGTKLTNEDMRQYFQAWKDGNYSQSCYVSIKLAESDDTFKGEWNIREIVKGIADPKDIVDVNGVETVVFKREDGKETEIEIKENRKLLTVYID